MGEYKLLNIKSQTYYFFDVMMDIRNFQSKLLKIDKTPYKHIDMYFIGYITMKKFNDCEHIHNVNPLYLIINSTTRYFKEKNGEKYLILDSAEKYEEVFLEFYQKLKQLMVEKNNSIRKIMLELELIQMMTYL